MFHPKKLKLNDYAITNLPYELIMCIMKNLARESPNAWANATASCSLLHKLLKFFIEGDEDEAFQLMIVALNLYHHEAIYCLNFMKLFTATAEHKEEGIQGLSMLEDNSKSAYYVTTCRWKLKNRLLKMKYKFPNYLDVSLFCNSSDGEFLSHLKSQLPHNQCPRCVADIEVVYMSAISTCKHIATV
ncbi:hypothetical protein OROMI_028779 [Orobanche minor]